MNLSALITQLETVSDLTGKVMVGMPAQLENIGSAPYAWLTNIVETAGGSPVTGPVRQRVDLRVEITVGAQTLDGMLSVRDDIRAALIGFQIDGGHDPMTFRAGRMEFADPGWNLWRDDYATAYYIN